MKIFVEKVRLEKGLFVSELAKKSGVAYSHVHNIEAGVKIPTITVLCKLAKALNVHCSTLFSCEDGDDIRLLPCDEIGAEGGTNE